MSLFPRRIDTWISGTSRKIIEKKEGHLLLSDEYFSIIDLPGAYSLTAHSEEEIITRQYVVEEKPDLVCVIVDATRLERTSYIALQALELTDNIALIVNMMDLAEKENIQIDRHKLEKQCDAQWYGQNL
ncbi:unnamed protein product [marine sediment metagenome]|uniref:FeoB-type G domain-containing protein n=1 Tax=marine sediment metagenome TaxID=412755 RepID=X1ESE6_9ZZZZ